MIGVTQLRSDARALRYHKQWLVDYGTRGLATPGSEEERAFSLLAASTGFTPALLLHKLQHVLGSNTHYVYFYPVHPIARGVQGNMHTLDGQANKQRVGSAKTHAAHARRQAGRQLGGTCDPGRPQCQCESKETD